MVDERPPLMPTTGTAEAPALRVRGIHVTLGGAGVLDDVTFDVGVGSVTGLVGPNGAGKSTLMRVITGLQRPDRGEALLLGQPLPSYACPLRVLGVLSDTVRADPRMTPHTFLRYLCAWSGIPSGRVTVVLDETSAGGFANKRIGSLSTGMRQRVMLSAALLGDPWFLLLDEPHNGLDLEGVRWMRDFLRDFANRGRSVLIASHLLTEIGNSADQLVILNKRVRFIGSPSELKRGDDIEDAFTALIDGRAG